MTFDAILRPRSDEQAASCRGVARSPLLPGLRPMARLASCSEDGWPGREAEQDQRLCATAVAFPPPCERERSEEHTSELQSLMRISYAVFCLKKKKRKNHTEN